MRSGCSNEVDIHMGTFSKSFGVYGAYVCGSRTLIRWLVNKARPLIYSTALPPSLVTGITTSSPLVQADHWRREQLFSLSRLFRSRSYMLVLRREWRVSYCTGDRG